MAMNKFYSFFFIRLSLYQAIVYSIVPYFKEMNLNLLSYGLVW